jgi:fumarate reductase subunit C
MAFIGRELTSVFVAYSAVLLVVLVVALDRGEGAYLEVMGWLSRPAVVGAHVLVLFVVLFHTITWLNLAPMAIVAKIGGRRVPASVVLLGHYAAWAVCTGFVAWVLIWRQ